MFRKFVLAAAAATALGTAALVPTTASAYHWGGHHWGGHHWGHHWGWGHHRWGGWGGPRYWGVYGGCRRWVLTPWGWRVRWVC
jgi:hypothetical protein